jgi:AcrR family transcriptional regulator
MAATAEAPAGRREQNKARTRAQILDAARAVFVEIGYDAATVRDILRRTHLATGTFYNYFPDKQSVLLALVEEETRRARTRLRQARARAKSVEAFLRLAFQAYFDFIARDRVIFELLRRNAGVLRSLDVEATGFGAGVDELRRDLEAAIAAGRLPSMDVEYMTAAIAGVAFELGVKMVERSRIDADGTAAFATSLFLGAFERMQRAPRGARKEKRNVTSR